jgi:hypothetical protein
MHTLAYQKILGGLAAGGLLQVCWALLLVRKNNQKLAVFVQSACRTILIGLAAGQLQVCSLRYSFVMCCTVAAAMAPGVSWPDMHTLAYQKIVGGLAAGGLLQVCWLHSPSITCSSLHFPCLCKAFRGTCCRRVLGGGVVAAAVLGVHRSVVAAVGPGVS